VLHHSKHVDMFGYLHVIIAAAEHHLGLVEHVGRPDFGGIRMRVSQLVCLRGGVIWLKMVTGHKTLVMLFCCSDCRSVWVPL
jgi:hypothetical protein